MMAKQIGWGDIRILPHSWRSAESPIGDGVGSIEHATAAARALQPTGAASWPAAGPVIGAGHEAVILDSRNPGRSSGTDARPSSRRSRRCARWARRRGAKPPRRRPALLRQPTRLGTMTRRSGRSWVIGRLEREMDSSGATAVQQLSPSLYRVEDICNVYLIKRGDRAILIDSGTGLVAEVLARLGVKQVDWVLHTHFHRDQCDGTAALARSGAKVAVPKGELGYFADAEGFWRARGIYDNYDTYNDFFAPTASVAIDRPLGDDETFAWQGLDLTVVPAPGHTKGGVAERSIDRHARSRCEEVVVGVVV